MTKMNVLRKLLPAAVAAAMSAPLAANAGIILEITDGITSTFISDNGAGDMNGLLGGVAYFGPFKNWEITAAFGTSATDPLQIHLTSLVNGNAGDGSLTIKFTQTDLTSWGIPIYFSADGGGSGATGSLGSWAAYVDDSNTAFGTSTLIYSSTGYTTGSGGEEVALSGLYSATLVTSFDYRFVTVQAPMIVGSSIDVSMRVPEPSTIGLLGLGLVGLAAFRRRRTR